jgi:hypothetical protein
LVAAGEAADAGLLVGGFDAEGVEEVLVAHVLCGEVEAGGGAAKLEEAREREVEADGLGEDEAVAFAVFGHEDEAAGDRVAGRGGGVRGAAEHDVARDAVAPRAEEVHEEFGAARAHEAAKAKDFAGAEIEAEVVEEGRGVF